MVKINKTEGKYHSCFQNENFNDVNFLKEQKTLLNKTYLFLDYENMSNFIDDYENNLEFNSYTQKSNEVNSLNGNINPFQFYSFHNNLENEYLFLVNNKKVKEIIDFSYELNKKVYGNNFSKKSCNMFFDKGIYNSNSNFLSDNPTNKNTSLTLSNDIESLSILFSIFVRKLIMFLYIFNSLIKSDKLKSFMEKVVNDLFGISEFCYNENYTNMYNYYNSDYSFIINKIRDYYIFIPKITINEKVYRIYFDKFYFQKDDVVKTFFTYIGKFLEWKGNITYIDVKNSLFKFMLDFDINKIANDFSLYSEKSKNGKDLNKKVEKMFFDIRNLFTRKRKGINKESCDIENSFVNETKENNHDYFTLLERINNDFTKEFRKQVENRINGLPFSDVDLFSILSREFKVDRDELKHEFIVFVNKFISKLQKSINSKDGFFYSLYGKNIKRESLNLSNLEREFEDFISNILLNSNFKYIDIYYNLIKNKLFYYFRISKENSDIQRKFYYDYAKYLWSYQKTLLERFEIKNFKLLYINFDGLIILEI